MKTSDEIKKGLAYCVRPNSMEDQYCKACPYEALGDCIDAMERDALDYIQQLEEREWELFDDLSRAWHGKTYYFKQDDGTVYSRESCDYMTLGEAIDEFTQTLIGSNDMP